MSILIERLIARRDKGIFERRQKEIDDERLKAKQELDKDLSMVRKTLKYLGETWLTSLENDIDKGSSYTHISLDEFCKINKIEDTSLYYRIYKHKVLFKPLVEQIKATGLECTFSCDGYVKSGYTHVSSTSIYLSINIPVSALSIPGEK